MIPLDSGAITVIASQVVVGRGGVSVCTGGIVAVGLSVAGVEEGEGCVGCGVSAGAGGEVVVVDARGVVCDSATVTTSALVLKLTFVEVAVGCCAGVAVGLLPLCQSGLIANIMKAMMTATTPAIAEILPQFIAPLSPSLFLSIWTFAEVLLAGSVDISSNSVFSLAISASKSSILIIMCGGVSMPSRDCRCLSMRKRRVLVSISSCR